MDVGLKCLNHSEEETSIEKMPPVRLAYRQIYRGHFLINNILDVVQFTVGGATPKQEVLSGIRKQAEQALESKTGSCPSYGLSFSSHFQVLAVLKHLCWFHSAMDWDWDL